MDHEVSGNSAILSAEREGYSCNSVELFHQLNIVGLPGLVEPGLKWTIQSQDGEPALAWNSLHPVALLSGRGLGPKVQVDRGIVVHLNFLVLAADARELLIRLNH